MTDYARALIRIADLYVEGNYKECQQALREMDRYSKLPDEVVAKVCREDPDELRQAITMMSQRDDAEFTQEDYDEFARYTQHARFAGGAEGGGDGGNATDPRDLSNPREVLQKMLTGRQGGCFMSSADALRALEEGSQPVSIISGTGIVDPEYKPLGNQPIIHADTSPIKRSLMITHTMLDVLTFLLICTVLVVIIVEYEAKIRKWIREKADEKKKPQPLVRRHTSFFPSLF